MMTAKILRLASALLTVALMIVAPSAWAGGEKLKVVMLGDSLTAGCNWQSRLGEVEVVNQGISGDSTWSIAVRLDQVAAVGPDLIFLQAGINDFGKKPSPEGTLARHQKIWSELRAKLPEAELYVVSLLPVSAKRYPRWGRPIIELNAMLKEAAEESGIIYIDVYSRMSDREGGLLKDFTSDGLHLLPRAYDQWVEAIRPYINKAVAVKGKSDDRRQADHNAG